MVTSDPCLTVPDSDLIARVQEQDPAAFEILYERYHDAIFRHLESIVRSETGAQDLLQEVFLRVWQRAEQWNGQGAFKSWLYRIATNLALNWLRSQKRRSEQPLVMPEENQGDEWSEDYEPTIPGWLIDHTTPGPAGEMERAERGNYLRNLIASLPEDKREVFRLVHELELSIRDVADQLGIPEGTVKSRLHYTQKMLSQAWQEWDR